MLRRSVERTTEPARPSDVPGFRAPGHFVEPLPAHLPILRREADTKLGGYERKPVSAELPVSRRRLVLFDRIHRIMALLRNSLAGNGIAVSIRA
jgi:hypothetical protein